MTIGKRRKKQTLKTKTKQTYQKKKKKTKNERIIFIIYLLKHSVPSSAYSNEGAPIRFVEQRASSLQSSNDRLEKELEKMGEKLDALEDRKNELMQEVIFYIDIFKLMHPVQS